MLGLWISMLESIVRRPKMSGEREVAGVPPVLNLHLRACKLRHASRDTAGAASLTYMNSSTFPTQLHREQRELGE